MVRGYPLFGLRFCHWRLYLHAIGRERVTQECTGQGSAGGLQLAWAVRYVVVCHEVVSEIGGWWEPDSLCFKVSFSADWKTWEIG